MKRILIISLLLSLAFCHNVFASGSSVVFKGGEDGFIITPSDTDLFTNLKNAHPGDMLTEEITIKNDSSDHPKINIYLRAVPIEDESAISSGETVASMTDFLSQLTLRVYNNGELLSESSADELGGLASNVLLGEFGQGEETVLTVKLVVPNTLGNEYANRTGELDWVFTAEEPDAPENPDNPEEPDNPENPENPEEPENPDTPESSETTDDSSVPVADTGRFTAKTITNAISENPAMFGVCMFIVSVCVAIIYKKRNITTKKGR